MNKLRRFTIEDTTDVRYLFQCPGCERSHWIRAAGPQPCWQFNGDVDKPTFSPSLLIRSEDATGPTVCHSFIKDGQIQFLGDCTHKLANQTVDIPDFDAA